MKQKLTFFQTKWLNYFSKIHDRKERIDSLKLRITPVNHFAKPILRNIRLLYDPLYYRCASNISLALKTGYQFSGLTETPTIPLLYTFHSFKPLSAKRENIILFCKGSFNPFHKGHLALMQMAESKMRAHFNVIGCVFAISHLDQVIRKTGTANLNQDRLLSIDNHLCNTPKHYQALRVADLCHSEDITFSHVGHSLLCAANGYFNKKVKVAYVFGSDNANIAPIFTEDFKGVCVARVENLINLPHHSNLYEVNHLDSNTSIVSAQIRASHAPEVAHYSSSKDSRNYMLRDDLWEATSHLSHLPNYQTAIKYFRYKVSYLLTEFSPYKPYIFDLSTQQSLVNNVHFLNKTISVDKYIKGDYNVEISKYYKPDLQYKHAGFTSRSNVPLQQQLSAIPSYLPLTFIDNNLLSGNTRSFLAAKLNIKDTFLACTQQNEHPYDFLDLSELLTGATHSGLKIKTKHSIISCPKIEPFVNLHAIFKISNSRIFSKELITLNQHFYDHLGYNLPTAGQLLSKNFCAHINLPPTTSIHDFFEYNFKLLGF